MNFSPDKTVNLRPRICRSSIDGLIDDIGAAPGFGRGRSLALPYRTRMCVGSNYYYFLFFYYRFYHFPQSTGASL